jgi:hypothetical protein
MLSQELKAQIFKLPPSDRLALISAIVESLQNTAIAQPDRSDAIQRMRGLLKSDSTSTQTDLQTLSTQFWQGTTLDQLLATQTPKTFQNLQAHAANFWPEEDSIEDFLTFLRQQRQEIS